MPYKGQLGPLVQGGQGAKSLAITHNPTAQSDALEAFVHGVDIALLTGAGLTFMGKFVSLLLVVSFSNAVSTPSLAGQ